MIRNGLLIIAALVFLAGCTLIPGYTRPAAPVPGTWPTGAAYKEAHVGEGALQAPDIGWQQFYLDEKLQKVIALALANNRDLRIATLNIKRARALYGIQQAELFPAVSASGSYTEQRIPRDVSQIGDAYSVRQYGINLGDPLATEVGRVAQGASTEPARPPA